MGRGRRPRRPVCLAQSYLKPLLLGEVAAQRLLCKLAVERSETGMQTERSNTSNAQRDPSVVGEPLPRLFSPVTIEKRFDAAAVLSISPIVPISRRSAQDDLLK